MKRFLALVMILTMLISAIPAAQLSVFAEATAADYEIHGLMQYDNGWHPNEKFILRWYNPSVMPDKVSLYAVDANGIEMLLSDSLDTTADAKVLYRVNTSGLSDGAVCTYKIVCAFANGKTTEQYTSAKLITRGNDEWNIEKTVGGIWKTDRKRFGGGNYESFPGDAEVIYRDGNSSLRITSADDVSALDWDRKVSLYIPTNGLVVGENYTLSFKYKQKNCKWVWPKGQDIGIWQGLTLGGTENWQEKEYKFAYNAAAKGDNFAFWTFGENEEFLLDDIKLVKDGTDENLIPNGDFESFTNGTTDVEGAYRMNRDGKTKVGWTDAGDAEYIDVYKVLDGSEVRVARLDANKGSVEFTESDAEYILRAVKDDVESQGIKAEVKLPTYTASEYAAKSAALYDNGWNWNNRFKATWFNPSASLEKTELFLMGTDGSETLVEGNFDLTENKEICYSINTSNPNTYPTGGNGVYTYKIKFTFRDGTVTEQYITNQIKDYSQNSAMINVWNEVVNVDSDWMYYRARADKETFPGKAEKVKVDGNGVLRVTSNTDYQAPNDIFEYSLSLFMPYKSLVKDKSYTVSFRYRVENGTYIFLKTPTAWENLAKKTGWQTVRNTFTYDGNAYNFRLRIPLKNQELLIDDFTLTEEGSNVNLVSDPGFDNADSMPKDVLKASYRTENGRDILTWKESVGIDFVDIFKSAGGEEIYMGRINKSVRTASFAADSAADKYIIRTVVGTSVSAGADAEYSENPYAEESTDEFAAKDLMAYNSGKSGEMYISWKNADNSDIKNVYLVDGNGNKVADGFSTEANAVTRYEVKNLANPTVYYSYRLVTETKNGGEIEQPVSGMWYAATEAHKYVLNTDSLEITQRYQCPIYNQDMGTRLSPIYAEECSDEHTDGAKSLKVFNALNASWDEEGLEIAFKPSEPLQKEKTYTISLKQKGSLHMYQKVFWGGTPADLNSGGTTYNKEWTTRTLTQKLEKDVTSVRILFLFAGLGECYIDDVKITDETGAVVYSESFENLGTNSAVIQNLTAEAKDGAAELKWTAPGLEDEIPKVTRIYAEVYGNKYLVGTFDPNASGYTVKGLDNGTEYKFIAETVTEDGIVSAAREVFVTPAAGAYSVNKITLTDENGAAVSSDTLTAGKYKAQAYVKNNEMGGSFTAEVVICLYDGNTLYSAASSGDVNIPMNDWKNAPEKLVTGTLTVPNTEGHNFSIKVYVWQSLESMQPLADTKEFFN